MAGYDEAKKYLGKHETKDRQFLINLFKSEGINVDPSTTPWCAYFVNLCEKLAGNPGNGRANARSFLTYGQLVYDRDKKLGNLANVKRGDIVVFERGGSTWQGHVAYVDGIETGKYGEKLVRTLGGNQADSVSIGWYPVSRVLGVRRA